MKKFLLGSVAAIALGGSAMAADMPLKAPPAPMIAPTWTGTYIGINGGYAWGTSNQTGPTGVTSGDYNIQGGVAGVTYGGNWQAGHVVLGFESDFDWAHINGSTTNAVCAGANCFTNTKWLSTERMRAGWDFNGWLLYGTVGAAFGRVNAGQDACGVGLCGEGTRAGWTGGVGIETMFLPNWSAKLEYLHYDLGSSGQFSAVRVLDRGDMIRAGINYHFDLLNLLNFH